MPRVEAERTRIIAFYLPQYHPIPENDAWWGKGFTEWSFVSAARPLYPAHEQPRRPSDLGYYDLRSPESRQAQADLASAYGIDAFCYYHYWFEGRRLLERPLDEVRASGQPELPFCVCWVNESWSRNWMGEERELLVRQGYSAADDREHAEHLAGLFADPRYLRVDGRPLLLIYRPTDLPDPFRTIATMKQAAQSRGLAEPYIVGANTRSPDLDCRTIGFDATLDWLPKLGCIHPRALDRRPQIRRGTRNLAARRRWLPRLEVALQAVATASMGSATSLRGLHPMALVGWDNTPRLGDRGIVLEGRSPRAFEADLEAAVARAHEQAPGHRLAFVFAWNEWCEGAYLEPDERFGRGFLEAVARVQLRERRRFECS